MLAPYCVASSVREQANEQEAANVAVLVETARQPGLEQAIGKLAGVWLGRVDLRVLGPLAPYDFVATAVPGGG